MQSGGKGPKWTERARIGMYLGNSPIHARSVALVLNLETGLVSPQFHIRFDDLFETASTLNLNIQWHKRTGFFKPTGTPTTEPPVPDSYTLPPVAENQASQRESGEQSQPVETSSPNNDENLMSASEGAVTASSHPTVEPNASANIGSHSSEPEGSSPAIKTATYGKGVTWADVHSQPAPTNVPTPVPVLTTRTRTIRPPERYRQDVAFIAQAWDDIWDIKDYEIQESMSDPVAFAATTNPDTMYLHQALRAPDREKFIEAMAKEVQDHESGKHWEVVSKSEVPQGTSILPAVWSMKRKRRITTNEIYKWKARLNLHGGKQVKGVHYWETFAPVVRWSSIRLFLTLAAINKWRTRQVDFVLAYPQADIETVMYMEIPKGFEFNESRDTHCLRLKKNLYGQKQAGRVWNQHLHKGLIQLGFKQSTVDECVYYRDNTILLCYVDDTIIIDPKDQAIDKVIEDLRELKFNVTDEGQIEDYLGVKIERMEDGKLKFSQPHLIDQILHDLNLTKDHNETTRYKTKSVDIPAPSTVILERNVDGEPHKEKWSYRSIIGKLNYLEKSTRPDLAYSVHNAARFSADPKTNHSTAVKRIGRYLLGTRDKGIIMTPDPQRSLEVYADADFCGLYNHETAIYDPATAKSRTGYVIKYMGCPIVWASKLQTETALSTCEAEYISCSEALRTAIPIMDLIDEASSLGFNVAPPETKVLCNLFCDNTGAVELIRLPKIRPRTKHINSKMHHFREHVASGRITVQHVPTTEQVADIATKPLSAPLFEKFRDSILGW
jgi:hypothetical protein